MDETERVDREAQLENTERLTLMVSPVLKHALEKVASGRQSGMATIVREGLRIGLPQMYNEFNGVYENLLKAYTNKLG